MSVPTLVTPEPLLVLWCPAVPLAQLGDAGSQQFPQFCQTGPTHWLSSFRNLDCLPRTQNALETGSGAQGIQCPQVSQGWRSAFSLPGWVAEATGLAQGKESGLSHCLLCSNSLPVFVNPLAGTGPECDSDQPGRALLSLKEDEAEREREKERERASERARAYICGGEFAHQRLVSLLIAFNFDFLS